MGLEVFPGWVVVQIDVGPVVESGAFEVAIADFKSQGTDQMKAGASGGAGSGDAACVGGDLWVDEDNVEHF